MYDREIEKERERERKRERTETQDDYIESFKQKNHWKRENFKDV